MTDHVDSLPEPSDAQLDALSALLSDAEAWEVPPRSIEDAIVAEITLEVTAGDIVPIRSADGGRRWGATRLLGAAAVVAVVVAGVAVLVRGDSGGTTFALVGTEAAPDASADATVAATPAGLKIVLDPDGLPGAPEGYMYEAWVGDGETVVSAGSFHLRGGDDPIELWAGVADPKFDRLWITLEPLDDDLSPSKDARLRGKFDLSSP